MTITCHRILLGVAAAAGLAACASGAGPHVPIPDEPGLYAVPALRAEADDQDDLQRLDGGPDWEVETWGERSDLSSDVQFVIQDPALASVWDGSPIELWKVAWIRSDLRSDGRAQPVDGSEWAVARLDSFRVPLAYREVLGRPDVIHVVPQERLPPGLYSLQLRKGSNSRSARFGIGWPTIDRQEYAAAHCVDRRSGAEPLYVPCDSPEVVASDGAAAAKGLAISLIDPVGRTESGERVLLLQGTITNQATAPRAVPMLVAALQDRSGGVLGRWTFAAEQSQLGPGQSATFRTEIRNAPAGTARVNVSFARNSATSAQ